MHPEERVDKIVAERQASYGHPGPIYLRAVGAFNALTGHTLSPQEGVVFMVCLKLAREVDSGFPEDYTDNVDDVAGYANVLSRVKEMIDGPKRTSE